MEISVLVSEWEGHRLLDTGDGFKLEEIGGVRMVRSEPKAWWSKALPESEWNKAVAVHEEAGRDSRWKLHGNCPKEWETKLGQLRFQLRFMDNSKQFGVFAEQSPHWKWVSQQKQTGEQRPRLLNLFGYTGAASLVAAQAGWLDRMFMGSEKSGRVRIGIGANDVVMAGQIGFADQLDRSADR